MKYLYITLVIHLVTFLPTAAQQHKDSEQLGRAIEYFQSGKYQEALGLFSQLDKHYHLNPRFKAYIGVCHYHEWNYKKAIEYLDTLMPQLEVFAPHERSLYYYACAESHFNLANYEEAIPLYEKFLLVCYNNEKGDAFFRLGFCHMFTYDFTTAYENFISAKIYYQIYRSIDEQGRLSQSAQMARGLEDKLIRQGNYFIYDTDSIPQKQHSVYSSH